jgi:hypothetical protein
MIQMWLSASAKQLSLSSKLNRDLYPMWVSPPLENAVICSPVGCDSPLQIVIAVWRTIFKFELSGPGVSPLLTIMAVWRASNKKKMRQKTAITIAESCHIQPAV